MSDPKWQARLDKVGQRYRSIEATYVNLPYHIRRDLNRPHAPARFFCASILQWEPCKTANGTFDDACWTRMQRSILHEACPVFEEWFHDLRLAHLMVDSGVQCLIFDRLQRFLSRAEKKLELVEQQVNGLLAESSETHHVPDVQEITRMRQQWNASYELVDTTGSIVLALQWKKCPQLERDSIEKILSRHVWFRWVPWPYKDCTSGVQDDTHGFGGPESLKAGFSADVCYCGMHMQDCWGTPTPAEAAPTPAAAATPPECDRFAREAKSVSDQQARNEREARRLSAQKRDLAAKDADLLEEKSRQESERACILQKDQRLADEQQTVRDQWSSTFDEVVAQRKARRDMDQERLRLQEEAEEQKRKRREQEAVDERQSRERTKANSRSSRLRKQAWDLEQQRLAQAEERRELERMRREFEDQRRRAHHPPPPQQPPPPQPPPPPSPRQPEPEQLDPSESALLEYNRQWKLLAPHDSTFPMPSRDFRISGLRAPGRLNRDAARKWPVHVIMSLNAKIFFLQAFRLRSYCIDDSMKFTFGLG